MTVVYVGPTILGVATRNTTYSSVPVSILEAAETAPFLVSLCAPVSDVAEATRQIREKSGAYWTFYSMALGYKPSQN